MTFHVTSFANGREQALLHILRPNRSCLKEESYVLVDEKKIMTLEIEYGIQFFYKLVLIGNQIELFTSARIMPPLLMLLQFEGE